MKKSKRILFLLIGIMCFLLLIINYDFGNNTKQLNNGESLIFAHKGIANYNPENSIKSFDACKTYGLTAIETDVRQMGDGSLIVFHDSHFYHMLGDQTLVQDVGVDFIMDKYLIKGDPLDSLQVLTFDEFLSMYKDDYYIYLDIKTVTYEVADLLLEKFESYDLYDKCIVADADIFFLSYLKLKENRIITALEGFGSGKAMTYKFIPETVMPDYFSSYLREVDADHINFLKEKGMLDRFIAYSVDKYNIEEADSLGVKNIIVDYNKEMGRNPGISEYSKSIKNRR